MTEQLAEHLPEVGQALRVRNRLATVKAVEAYDTRTAEGRLHLVEVEYLDDCRHPESDQLLWETEPTASVLGTTSLPAVDASRPDSPEALRAFINANRWSRVNRLRDSEDITDEPLLGVWNSAVQVLAYQLEPVLRALEMPRVSLLLADGVGIGKTIQAGLVLQELLLRRRIRRVLVLCPAMLQRQWRYEFRRKFNLDFQILDSDSIFELRRRLGIDTNPWKAFPRVITSMDYLRMPDVLQQFLQASGAGPEGDADAGRASPHAPWDLLIVDEAHHFAPQSGSRTTQRTRMLREIRFLFEHRIFASATPHNGKTVCFTGLLELLDPVRFQMTASMEPQDHERLEEVRIRRLKADINKHYVHPPFADMLDPEELPLQISAKEVELYAALRKYRQAGLAELARAESASEKWLGQFVFSILTKRLLSCPFAFARTWWRHVEDGEDAELGDLLEMARVSARRVEDQTESDDLRSAHEDDTARYGGAWLRRRGSDLLDAESRVNKALSALAYDRAPIQDTAKLPELAEQSDSKTDVLVAWVKANLYNADMALRDDERLIVFTEYKETLTYLKERFEQEGFDENTMRLLYGGMGGDAFEKVKEEFEDAGSAVRLLLATDAASEGINLQHFCRWVIHYDVPWSPSKIVQRNGRVFRHGQLRDVTAYYFRSDQEEDIEFLRYVAGKVQSIEEDLGSVERVFSDAIQRHFQGVKIRRGELEALLKEETGRSLEKQELGRTSDEKTEDTMRRAAQLLERTDASMGVSPKALVELLRSAIAVEGGGSLDAIEGKPGFFRLNPPPRWEHLVRETLTVGPRMDRKELVFDVSLVEEESAGRRALRLKKHQELMRLGHPVMRQAVATLRRQLYDPSGKNSVFRWSVAALDRTGFEVLLVLYYTLTAINELRESLHDEVLSEVFRVEGDNLVPVEKTFRDAVLTGQFLPIGSAHRLDEWVRTLRGRWFQHRRHLEEYLEGRQASDLASLQKTASAAREREVAATKESYQGRLLELQKLSDKKELLRLARAMAEARREADQLRLFEEDQETAELLVKEYAEQLELLRRDVERTRDLLTRERERRLKLLPQRFKVKEVRVLPLAVEYLVPALAEDMQS